MKIVDSFQFSEPFEKELLLTKLNLGSDVVDEWLICENSYTHQGKFKGHYVNDILHGDERFIPFMDRIKVFEGDRKGVNITEKEGVNDKTAISNEVFQRQLSRNYILDNYSDADYVLLSDCDECPDFSNPVIRDIIFKKLRRDKKGIVKAPRIRFWYDVDNLWREPRATPFVNVGLLKRNSDDFCHLRYSNLFRDPAWVKPVIFEYSFNFSKEDIIKKYSSFIHTAYLKEEILLGVKCNHLPVSSQRNQKIDLNEKWWLKKIDLNETNSPAYIRENYDKIRTQTVDENYLENRYLYYPELYSRKFFSLATYKQARASLKAKGRQLKEVIQQVTIKL